MAKKYKAKSKSTKSQTTKVVYLGTADKASVIGKVTGKKYVFTRDSFGMPKPLAIDEQDYQGIVSLRGKPCCGKDNSEPLYQSSVEWNMELQQAKKVNSK